MSATVSLTARRLRGTFAQAGYVRELDLQLASGDLMVITAAEERPRRNMLRLLSGHSPIISGALEFRSQEFRVDLATASARDTAWVRTRQIVCSVNLPPVLPSLTCERGIAQLADCDAEEAATELAAAGYDHAIGMPVGDARGVLRNAVYNVAALLHPAPLTMLDMPGEVSQDMLLRIRARNRAGDAVLIATDALVTDLPAHTLTSYLSGEGILVDALEHH